MPVGAVAAGGVEIVEQHELLGEKVLVGGDILTEHHQRWVAVAARHVAEDLVVGAVLLDDVDDVLDERRVARTHGHRERRLGWRGGGERGAFERQAVVLRDGEGVGRQLRLVGKFHHVHRPAVGVHEALARLAAPTRTGAEQRADGEVPAIGTHVQRIRVPRRRNQAVDGERRRVHHRHGVDAAAGHEQARAIRGERERGGGDAGHLTRKRLNRDLPLHGVGASVYHGDGLLVVVRHVEPFALLVPGQRVGMQSRGDAVRHL